MFSTLDTLLEDCLLAILDYIPLNELMCTIPLVCTRMYTISLEAIRLRRHLVLVFGDRQLLECAIEKSKHISSRIEPIPVSTYQLEHCRVMVHSQMRHDHVLRLLSRLSGIISLHVLVLNEPHYDSLLYLTNLIGSRVWKTRLVSLKICYAHSAPLSLNSEYKQRARDHLFPFWQAVNGLWSLKYLALEDRADYLLLSELDIIPQFSIVAQLNHLTFHAAHHQAYKVLDAIEVFGLHNGAPKKIRLGLVASSSIDSEVPALYVDFGRNYTSTHFDHFTLKLARIDGPSYRNGLHLLCHHLSSLTTLTLHYNTQHEQVSLAKLTRKLASLDRLTTLELHCGSRKGPFYKSRIESGRIVPLPSVKALKLDAFITSHRSPRGSSLDVIFPNLQLLVLANRSSKCDVCKYHMTKYSPDQWYGELKGARSNCMLWTIAYLFDAGPFCLRHVSLVLPEHNAITDQRYARRVYRGEDWEMSREEYDLFNVESKAYEAQQKRKSYNLKGFGHECGCSIS